MPLDCEIRTYARSPVIAARERDYDLARLRFRGKRGHRFERGYDVASHFAQLIRSRRREENDSGDQNIQQEFQNLTERWWRETRVLSSIHSKIFNPNYQRIIGMGKAVLPLIFSELRHRGGQWYWALECITGDNPAVGAESLPEAKRLWLEYANQHNYL